MAYYNYPNNFSNCNMNNQYYQPETYANNPSPYSYPYITEEGYRNANANENENFIPTLPNSWNFGPVKVEWTFDGKSINLVLRMFEDAVENLILSMAKPMVTISTNIGEATINLKVNADFTTKQIYLSGAACFDTICTTFNNTIIASW